MLTDQELDEIEARLKFYEGEYWRVSETDPFQVAVTNHKGQPDAAADSARQVHAG